ncbi:MAG: S8 family peptidase, partial [Thermoanaerobaculia bacterium]
MTIGIPRDFAQFLLVVTLAVGLLGCASAGSSNASRAVTESPSAMIVQGQDVEMVRRLVVKVGGTVTHELGIIHAVGGQLTPTQRTALVELDPDLRIFEDSTVETSAKGGNGKGKGKGPYKTQSSLTSLIDADLLHQEGITGSGVTIAVLDTGMWGDDPIAQDSQGRDRILAVFNASTNEGSHAGTADKSGHGTHVTSLMANSKPNGTGDFNGVAPDVDLISIQAFDAVGHGTYADVIRGIDWAVANKNLYGIRVLNLSFSAPPQSYYWDDPLNQAVMAAWRSGIVVVASAGNTGPDPMTVGVPGNVPYIITVGAMSDNFTPDDRTDDILASFSSVGPTYEAFVKPEIVAPGGHLLGSMQRKVKIAKQHPDFHDGGSYFTMSGTSQATAVVSGVAALMLQADPSMTPDDVKCRLMASARPAVND